ncbi:MAG: hypothetical protein IJW75_05235 [Alphaproteobacteria bacterium]|nr:hypothetical protein [Alphaproteobacteria bacterium]
MKFQKVITLNLLCYHKVEYDYKNYEIGDEYGNLLKMLVKGSITKDGYFKLNNDDILNKSCLKLKKYILARFIKYVIVVRRKLCQEMKLLTL